MGNPLTDRLRLGQTPQARGKEKIEHGLCWITDWRYSTGTRLATFVGCEQARGFVSHLQRRGWLQKIQTGAFPRTVLMLTAGGRYKAAEFTPHGHTYNLDTRFINPSRLRHHLLLQDLVLQELNSATTYTAHRLVPDLGQALKIADYKRPDALLQRGERTMALELELHYKAKSAIYRSFYAYTRLFRDHPEAYSQAVYVFERPAMRDHYRALFSASTWPVYYFNSRTRQYRCSKYAFLPDETVNLRERFHFQLIGENLPWRSPSPPRERLTLMSPPSPPPPRSGQWYQYRHSTSPYFVLGVKEASVVYANGRDGECFEVATEEWMHWPVHPVRPFVAPAPSTPARWPLACV